jgi:hypothetical protein
MNKTLVAVFNTEPAADEGLSALKELHKNGDLTLYATAPSASSRLPTGRRLARRSAH